MFVNYCWLNFALTTGMFYQCFGSVLLFLFTALDPARNQNLNPDSESILYNNQAVIKILYDFGMFGGLSENFWFLIKKILANFYFTFFKTKFVKICQRLCEN